MEVVLQPLQREHLEQAHGLSQAVGWPYRREDWDFASTLGRGTAALEGGRLLGTALWWPFGERMATLGMVIVAPEQQGRGLGRRLMQAVLEQTGARTVLLNATAEGLPLYRKLGFEPIDRVLQHQAACALAGPGEPPAGTRLRRAGPDDLSAIAAFDAVAAGFDRGALIRALAAVAELRLLERPGGIEGWSACRRFGRGLVIGPVAAVDAEAARALIRPWIAERGDAFLRLDTAASAGLSDWIAEQGLSRVAEVVTMARGPLPPREPAQPRLFALTNQALG